MPTSSAGVLMYRTQGNGIEVLLVHPGGPYWQRKDLGAWSIPKGEVHDGEDLLSAARRELQEETGATAEGPALGLGHVRMKSGKVVHAWAVAGDFDPDRLQSITFDLEWPRGSGVMRSFPEVDRAEWFALDEARRRILPAQAAFLDALSAALAR
jgi:predicted NUDIX family NTP pyrophosphohydrolase